MSYVRQFTIFFKLSFLSTDRPAAPGKIAVAMTLGRSVTLSWKEPEDDGGCKIGTYIVEYYKVRNQNYYFYPYKFVETWQ